MCVVFSAAPVRAEEYAVRPDAQQTLDAVLGTSREAIVGWLTQHETDDFYLGTPFPDSHEPYDEDWCDRPNGYFEGNLPQMNCAGFVADVLIRSGVSEGRLEGMVRWVRDAFDYDPEEGGYVDATVWFLYAVGHTEIRTLHFDTIEEAIASGELQKGDILYMNPTEESLWYGYDSYGNLADCHIGFYWGDSPGENRFWHSSDGYQVGVPGAESTVFGNQIGEITCCSESSVYVIPLSDPSGEAESEIDRSSVTFLIWLRHWAMKMYRQWEGMSFE